jgi:hypothetical protein
MHPSAELSGAVWRKSSKSTAQGNECVEVAVAPVSGCAAIRDSKDPDGPKVIFEALAWHRFVHQVKIGEYDRP